MANSVQKLDYFAVDVAHRPGEGARLLSAIADAGVNLIAVTGFPRSAGEGQVDFVPADADTFRKAAEQAGIKLREPKAVFIIQGDDQPGALAESLRTLAEADINVTAADAVAAGQGRFGAMLWVKPEDVERAATALGAD